MIESRCPGCPNKYRCVLGDGPLDARVLCVGEAPGKTEDLGGRPFIGEAGKEFNQNYLHLAGLTRDEIYITNTVRCRPDLNRKPSRNEAYGCANHHMPSTLAEIKPNVVVLMGATACSLIPEIDLETDHGIPEWRRLYEWEGYVIPMYHPASGLHDTAMMQPMLEDWEGLRPWLECRLEHWPWPVDDRKRDYRLAKSNKDVRDYFEEYFWAHPVEWVGGDTESQDGVWWSTQVSSKVGTGLMVLAGNSPVMRELGRHLELHNFIFHNASADLDIFTHVVGRPVSYRDTMQEAYHFANLRQGLKPLSRRLLGRKRKSWDETVTPYSKEVLAGWMCDGLVHAEENWRVITPKLHKKTGRELKPDVQQSPAEKMLRELYAYMCTNPEYKIWDKLRERMPVDWMDLLVDVCGPAPVKGIAHVPIEEAVYYGCSDADDTLALALEFDRMREEFHAGLNVQEEDVDG